jgi:glycosyltransferase involved in cell wall biosynthesis
MKLSIITVNLNNKDGLQKTIDSVISQTFRDFEWIVIDGGSTDGSKELIEQYAGYIAYWVSEPDKGIYNAMNKGIRAAKGEYCLFLNSGDCFYEDHTLEMVVSAGLDADIVYGYQLVEKNGERTTLNQPRTLSFDTFYHGNINHSGGSFIRTSLFERYGLYDENLRIVSDFKFCIQAIILGEATTKYVDILVSVFDGDGISSNMEEHLKERAIVLNSLIPKKILVDYEMMDKNREILIQREKQARSSASYRLGKTILSPIKKIMALLHISK